MHMANNKAYKKLAADTLSAAKPQPKTINK
jgi:hypothetical protein